jgi:hypothetical protein
MSDTGTKALRLLVNKSTYAVTAPESPTEWNAVNLYLVSAVSLDDEHVFLYGVVPYVIHIGKVDQIPVAIATETGTGTKIVGYGPTKVRNTSWSLTPGSKVYVEPDGTITNSATDTIGNVANEYIGYALTADTILFKP